MKIGMYTEEEIFQEIAHGFLGRSMYDAIFDKIHALLTENEKLKNRIEEDKEDISNLMDVLNKNCSELKCTSDEWLVIKLWQDRLGGDAD